MSVLIESMHRISLPRYVIRVWRQESPDFVYTEHAYSELDALAHKHQEATIDELARLLIAVDGVNAVEILNWNNNGIIYYSNWP